ncbi:MAG TPA: hypothetical protein VIG99_14115 [Myxococcaceae bacterium]|jgi:hypothetical protein
MPLSPLRSPAAPAQDAAHKLSPHQPSAHSPSHAPAALHRKSNPALLSASGASGFDAGTRPSGPKITLPTAPGAPEAVKAGQPGTADGAGATTGTAAVGSLKGSAIDAIFNKGSAVYEHILSGFGISSPPIEDPTARLQARSEQLGKALAADPSLKDKISHRDLMQAWHISQIFSNPDFLGALNDTQKVAVQSYQTTFAALRGSDWPPPPGGGHGN